MSCGVACRRGSDPALLWLWCRPAATALIRPLSWEPPYAMGAAQDIKTNKQTKKTTTWYRLIQVRMAIVKKSTNNKCWRGCAEKKKTLLYCWWKCTSVQPLWKTILQLNIFLKTIKTTTTKTQQQQRQQQNKVSHTYKGRKACSRKKEAIKEERAFWSSLRLLRIFWLCVHEYKLLSLYYWWVFYLPSTFRKECHQANLIPWEGGKWRKVDRGQSRTLGVCWSMRTCFCR